MTTPSLSDLTRASGKCSTDWPKEKQAGKPAESSTAPKATVKKHRSHIYRALGVAKAISAALFYDQHMQT